MAKATTKEVKAVLGIVMTVADIIRELGQIPSGHLYARLCGQMRYHDYESVIAVLTNAKLIENKNHLLVWVGPKGVDKHA